MSTFSWLFVHGTNILLVYIVSAIVTIIIVMLTSTNLQENLVVHLENLQYLWIKVANHYELIIDYRATYVYGIGNEHVPLIVLHWAALK